MTVETGGLCIALKEDHPVIIRIAGQEVKIYAAKVKGQHRARFIADRSVQIISPSRVKKGWTDELPKES